MISSRRRSPRSAAGALVSRLAASPLPQIEVRDSRRALGALARAWRASFSIPAIAVTGSSGKTTVKELIAAILGVSRSVCVTQGNLNNEIGVPLTLIRLTEEHDALVVELGANHAGEIDYLARLAQPTVGVITNAAEAHLEGFGSLQGVCLAKGELLDHLPRAGTAVINADDQFRSEWVARSRCEFTVTFGFAPSADCRVLERAALHGNRLGVPHAPCRMAKKRTFGCRCSAAPTSSNALAAASAAQAIGASTEDIVAGLARAAPVRGRLRAVPGRNGATIIDDSYNANPGSVHAALDHLAALKGRRIFVFGNMAELGPTGPALHQEIGEYARGRCDRLLAIGELAGEAAATFGAAGQRVADIDAARSMLDPLLASDVTVLVKGSRVMGLDRLVRMLEAEAQGTT